MVLHKSDFLDLIPAIVITMNEKHLTHFSPSFNGGLFVDKDYEIYSSGNQLLLR